MNRRVLVMSSCWVHSTSDFRLQRRCEDVRCLSENLPGTVRCRRGRPPPSDALAQPFVPMIVTGPTLSVILSTNLAMTPASL